jgi:hypothetical protein
MLNYFFNVSGETISLDCGEVILGCDLIHDSGYDTDRAFS